MIRLSFSLVIVVMFFCVSASLAQDLNEWEIPADMQGDLKAKKCPPGTEPDEKGWCVKTAPTTEKLPVEKPAVKPVLTPPKTTPAPEKTVPPKPVLRPDVTPKTVPVDKPDPKAPGPATDKSAPIIVPLPADKPPEPAPVLPSKTSPPSEDSPNIRPVPLDGLGDETKKEPDAPKEEGPTDEELAEAKRLLSTSSFVKGELADFIGSNKLVTKNNRVGVRLGYRQLDLAHYATINPEADFRIWKIQFGLGVPMALEIFNGAWDESKSEPIGFGNAGSFRTEDWNERSEYVRFIRYLKFGKKEDNIFFNLSQFSSTTIGHGPMMRRYSVNLDPDSTRLSAELDMYNDYAGFEFVVNSITDADLFGAIAFVKPLSFFMDHYIARSLSIGVTYMADRHAPVTLKTQTDPSINHYFLVGTGRPEVLTSAFLHGLGVDMEIKLLKTKNVDLKPYVDYSWYMPASPDGGSLPEPEGGGGFTLGLLGRFNFGEDPIQAVRAVVEFRSFSSNYLPGYFDTFYEVQKFIANRRYKEYASSVNRLPPTKFQDIFIDRKGGDRRLGFYLEFNYSLVEYFTLTLALEGSNANSANNLLVHVEVPATDWFQFFASYHHRAMDSLGDLFSSGAGDRIAFAAARVKVVPFIFLNFRYHYTFELREDYADLNNDGFEQFYRFYEAAHGWMADIEFGWEF
jgi:hypothetical protein